ncbi:MAG: hydrogenase nickel incorporation protein HypB [Lachnospiraceae bacterium]|nr:hydrogenase nickel incorporation protein HypB [Lachnospiraceae bacterium]
MPSVEIIDLKKKVLLDNEVEAKKLRDEMKNKKSFYINLMSSPGSGKTSSILNILKRLPEDIKPAVLEADIDSDVDAITIENAGVRSIQLHTGGMCHLDADMSRQALNNLPMEDYNFIILENVGNLVCPAEFDAGSALNMCILSITEGHDKPLKYPLMFETCDVVIINKIDALEVFDFDMDKAKGYIRERNPKAKVFPVSAKTGEGFDDLVNYLINYRLEYLK